MNETEERGDLPDQSEPPQLWNGQVGSGGWQAPSAEAALAVFDSGAHRLVSGALGAVLAACKASTVGHCNQQECRAGKAGAGKAGAGTHRPSSLPCPPCLLQPFQLAPSAPLPKCSMGCARAQPLTKWVRQTHGTGEWGCLEGQCLPKLLAGWQSCWQTQLWKWPASIQPCWVLPANHAACCLPCCLPCMLPFLPRPCLGLGQLLPPKAFPSLLLLIYSPFLRMTHATQTHWYPAGTGATTEEAFWIPDMPPLPPPAPEPVAAPRAYLHQHHKPASAASPAAPAAPAAAAAAAGAGPAAAAAAGAAAPSENAAQPGGPARSFRPAPPAPEGFPLRLESGASGLGGGGGEGGRGRGRWGGRGSGRGRGRGRGRWGGGRGAASSAGSDTKDKGPPKEVGLRAGFSLRAAHASAAPPPCVLRSVKWAADQRSCRRVVCCKVKLLSNLRKLQALHAAPSLLIPALSAGGASAAARGRGGDGAGQLQRPPRAPRPAHAGGGGAAALAQLAGGWGQGSRGVLCRRGARAAQLPAAVGRSCTTALSASYK